MQNPTTAETDTVQVIQPMVRIQNDPWHILRLRSMFNVFFTASTNQIVVNLITLVFAWLIVRIFLGPSGRFITTPVVLLALGSRSLFAAIPFLHRRLLSLESRQAVQCQSKLMPESDDSEAVLNLVLQTEPGWSLVSAGRDINSPPDVAIILFRDEPVFPFTVVEKEATLRRTVDGTQAASFASEELVYRIRIQMPKLRGLSATTFELSGFVRLTAKHVGSAIPHEMQWHFEKRLVKPT